MGEHEDKSESTDSLEESDLGDVIDEDDKENDGSSTSELESEDLGDDHISHRSTVIAKKPAKRGSETSDLSSEDLSNIGSDENKKARSAKSNEEEKKELEYVQELDVPIDTEMTAPAGDQSFTRDLGYDAARQVNTPNNQMGGGVNDAY